MQLIETKQVTVRREAKSPLTEIHWNPLTNDGMIIFRTEFLRFENDEYTGREPGNPVTVSLAQLFSDVITVQTESGPVQLPGPLLVAAVKQYFEDKVAALSNQEEPNEDPA